MPISRTDPFPFLNSLWPAFVRTGLRRTILRCCWVAAYILLLSVMAVLACRPPYQEWLDSFARRVSATTKENEVITWADAIFSDPKFAKRGDSVLRLPQTSVPDFFTNAFQGTKPSAVLSYSSSGTPVAIHVFIGGGFARWGIAVFNTNAGPANEAFDYRRCGARFYAFHSNR